MAMTPTTNQIDVSDIGTAPPWLRKPAPMPGLNTLPFSPGANGAGSIAGAGGSTVGLGGPDSFTDSQQLGSAGGDALNALSFTAGANGSGSVAGGGGSTVGLGDPSSFTNSQQLGNSPGAGAPTLPPAGPAVPAAPASAFPNYNTDSGMPSVGGAAPAAFPGTPGSSSPPDPWNVAISGLPPISTDFSGDAQRGADAAYKQATQFFDQDFSRDNSALESKLINQGFAPGTEAFNKEMEQQTRGQNAARENAALQAQQTGFSQAGDLLQRALASRAALYGEQSDNANRAVAVRGQDKGVETAGIGANASMANATAANDASKYGTDASTSVALRRLGLDQSNSDMTNLIALINSSRGGVNMPNFGAPTPLDVTGANSVAASNANAAANRTAANNNLFAQLGGSLLGSYFKNP